MPMIEIREGPAVRLADLLELIPNVDDLKWTIMEMWAVALSDDVDVVALERQASESSVGLQLPATQLRAFAGQLRQFIDGIVIAYQGPPPTRLEPDLRVKSYVVLEAFDGALWRVFARESSTTDRLRAAYTDVHTVDPEVPVPPRHDRS